MSNQFEMFVQIDRGTRTTKEKTNCKGENFLWATINRNLWKIRIFNLLTSHGIFINICVYVYVFSIFPKLDYICHSHKCAKYRCPLVLLNASDWLYHYSIDSKTTMLIIHTKGTLKEKVSKEMTYNSLELIPRYYHIYYANKIIQLWDYWQCFVCFVFFFFWRNVIEIENKDIFSGEELKQALLTEHNFYINYIM